MSKRKSKQILDFNNIEIKKNMLHKSKYPIDINDVYVDKIGVFDISFV